MRTDVEVLKDFKPIKLPGTVVAIGEIRGMPASFKAGDFVWWVCSNEYFFGRVVGLVRTKGPVRRRTGDICVVCFNNLLTYERFITKEQIYQVAAPTEERLTRASWFFSAEFNKTPERLARGALHAEPKELLAATQ